MRLHSDRLALPEKSSAIIHLNEVSLSAQSSPEADDSGKTRQGRPPEKLNLPRLMLLNQMHACTHTQQMTLLLEFCVSTLYLTTVVI